MDEISKEALLTIAESLDERGEVVRTENIAPLVDEAEGAGFVCRDPTGKMKMRDRQGESIRLAGEELPVIGTLYGVYVLTDAGRAALKASQ